MSEEEIIEKYHHFKIKTADGIDLDLIEIKYYKELLDLYKQEKEKNKELEIELDKTADLLNTCNKRLESISRELGLTDEHTYGYDYEEIINTITELKVKEKYKIEALEKQHEYDMAMIDEVKGQANEWINMLEQEKEKNKDLEEKLKIAVAILTKGTYPEENEGDNDFDKQFIAVDKIKGIQGRLFVQLGSYVRNEASPEQERIAGGINIINEILEDK